MATRRDPASTCISPRRTTRRRRPSHFGFLLPEAECRQLHARMVEACVRITRPLVEAPFLNFFCADPDGHEVQVYSDPAEL
jgi:hypothetical protein